MENADIAAWRGTSRVLALWLGGLAAGVAMIAQGFMSLWFASQTPEAAWRTCLGIVLALAPPSVGVVVYFRGDRLGDWPGGRFGRGEFASAVVALGLIVPTFMLVVVSGGMF